jgi:hypothetical protein
MQKFALSRAIGIVGDAKAVANLLISAHLEMLLQVNTVASELRIEPKALRPERQVI